jgi:hypothetical protein
VGRGPATAEKKPAHDEAYKAKEAGNEIELHRKTLRGKEKTPGFHREKGIVTGGR